MFGMEGHAFFIGWIHRHAAATCSTHRCRRDLTGCGKQQSGDASTQPIFRHSDSPEQHHGHRHGWQTFGSFWPVGGCCHYAAQGEITKNWFGLAGTTLNQHSGNAYPSGEMSRCRFKQIPFGGILAATKSLPVVVISQQLKSAFGPGRQGLSLPSSPRDSRRAAWRAVSEFPDFHLTRAMLLDDLGDI